MLSREDSTPLTCLSLVMCYHTLVTAAQKGKWYLVVTRAFGNMKIFSRVRNLYLYLAPSDRDWIFHISKRCQFPDAP